MSPPSTATVATNTTMSSSPAHAPASAHVVDDCAGLIKLFSDGSIVRSPDPVFPIPILQEEKLMWKEIQFNSTHNLNLRIYKPRHRHRTASKLPILLYLHGGGFCFGSCSWPHLHNCCARLAVQLNAVVVAPDYRLAPENRLPAAIEDGVSAVEWLRTQTDDWLADDADISNVIIMGDSSGGLMAHHLAVRFGSPEPRAGLAPVRITKYVLLGPFFGGSQRTKSELDCPKDDFLNLELTDKFWRLSLPVGADRDHPIANPFGPESASLEAVEFEETLVVVGERDLLRDRGVEYGERLKKMGKPVEVVEFGGQEHGFLTGKPDSESAIKLVGVLKSFVDQNSVEGDSKSATQYQFLHHIDVK